jgi:hypothetical protein
LRKAEKGRLIGVLSLVLLSPVPAPAQSTASPETEQRIEQLQVQIIELQRESQRRLEALQRQTSEQMRLLQTQVELLSSELRDAKGFEHETANELASATAQIMEQPNKLDISGDFRLRYESNGSNGSVPAWDRGVLRGRLAANYQLTDNLSLGARMVTGDAGNPRTSDVTIGNWLSDQEISLDQAYVSFKFDDLYLVGGKFAKPFKSTEILWDGDVNPQGFGVSYQMASSEHSSAQLSGIYFLIDEKIFEQSSDMLGGQLTFGMQASNDWGLSASAAYYEYDIGPLNLSGPGSPRGNNVTPDGRSYVSDYELLDVLGSVHYSGWGDRWDVKLVADYVKNYGANVPGDSAYGLDLFVGNLKASGRFQFRYGYSRVETDAVLGMFSNDNIVLATNYELHTFAVDYALPGHAFLGLTSYFYQTLDFDPEQLLNANDWSSRTRLNLYFQF